MASNLPFEIDNLSGAAARVLLAPITAPRPTKSSEIYDLTSPYAVNTPWFDVGATAGPLQVSRNITVAGYTIEQSQTPLLEEPTEVTYSVQVPFAELSPKVLQILNEGVTELVTSPPAGSAAGTKTHFGNIYDLTHFRIAFVVRKTKAQGEVIEPGGKKRGRYLTYVGYDCSMTGENVQTSFGKGQLSQAPVTFKLYPQDDIAAEGTEHGYYFDEDAQTVLAPV